MIRTLQVLVLALFTAMMTQSCTTDTVNPSSSITSIPNNDAWKITKYWDQDKDETSDFAQYLFYFRENNVFETVHNGSIVTGTWQLTHDDNLQRLVINIASGKPLSNLVDDWVIVESTTNSIHLRDDNALHLEEVIFEHAQ